MTMTEKETSVFSGGPFPILIGGDPFSSRQWYQPNTYYQILEVKPSAKEKNSRDGKYISTSILVKQRGTGDNHEPKPDSFDDFELDDCTIKNLKDHPRNGDNNKLSSHLPSPGVTFPKGFIDALINTNSNQTELTNNQTELTNFYQPIRSILYSRKISQLIAKTWWCYLEAKAQGLLDKFTAGEWDDILQSKTVDGQYILDGLIARQIFLFGGGSPPDEIKGDAEILISKPGDESVNQARFLILATSKSWQGISLSLLLAGQAYYKVGDKYHQISQPILSTGQIVSQYSHDVDWGTFKGDIKEIIVSQEKPWITYEVVLPYPPIPKEVEPGDVKKWADAKDDPDAEDAHREFPFYNKIKDEYLIDVKYFRPPYPYIPLSCT